MLTPAMEAYIKFSKTKSLAKIKPFRSRCTNRLSLKKYSRTSNRKLEEQKKQLIESFSQATGPNIGDTVLEETTLNS